MKIETYLKANDMVMAFEYLSKLEESCSERRVNVSLQGPNGRMDSLQPVKEKLKRFPGLVEALEQWERECELSIRELIKSHKEQLEKHFDTLNEQDDE
jgi:hypothetical protein